MDVIALISGGKDSFFSLLHSIANGHRIVALANLHPPSTNSSPSQITTYLPTSSTTLSPVATGTQDELDSFMYQTVGHTVLPLYPHALNIPLYRRAIIGKSVDQNLTYTYTSGRGGDETEDLVPLLEYILQQHPTATAVCTGAILSTYQRTRVESVCKRLGLTPLSYLWQRRQEEILADMEYVGLDARIVKVAAMGLDGEKWLWRNVVERSRRMVLEELERKWGVHVAGEGGEYETIVIDGPGWKGRIEVEESGREAIDAGGGVGYLKISKAKFMPKDEGGKAIEQQEWVKGLKIPSMWDREFSQILSEVPSDRAAIADRKNLNAKPLCDSPPKPSICLFNDVLFINNISSPSSLSISIEISNILQILSSALTAQATDFSRITSATLLLRSMADFTTINAIYSKYFTAPSPPSRVCISVGNLLPLTTNMILSVTVDLPPSPRKALHVQSHSYWAPANIGPYSQSITASGWTALAGMIPLVPASMGVVNSGKTGPEVVEQAVLSLQHMWRVARAAEVGAFLGCVAWVVGANGVDAVVGAWRQIWRGWNGGLGWRGLWGGGGSGCGETTGEIPPPPLLIVEVHELPRGCAVEWAGIGIDGPWLENAQMIHDEKSDGMKHQWGLKVDNSSMTFGGWDSTDNYLPTSGRLKMFCLPPSPMSALVEEVTRQSVGNLEVSNVIVYVPAATGSAEEFMQGWNDQFGVQAIPVSRVWAHDGKEMGLGVAVRLGVRDVRGEIV